MKHKHYTVDSPPHTLFSLSSTLLAGGGHSPKLDEACSGQMRAQCPLGNLTAVVLQLCSQHCSTLRVQLLTPVHPSRQLQRQQTTIKLLHTMRDHQSLYIANCKTPTLPYLGVPLIESLNSDIGGLIGWRQYCIVLTSHHQPHPILQLPLHVPIVIDNTHGIGKAKGSQFNTVFICSLITGVPQHTCKPLRLPVQPRHQQMG